MLSSARHPLLLRALFAASLALGCTHCVWLDDFDKFKIGDAGTPDAQSGQSRSDAGGDRCRGVTCGQLDGECVRGSCDPATGECKTVAVPDGQSCFDGNPCTTGDTCKAGECMGQALDCGSWDLECSQGMCDPASGACVFGPNVMSKPCNDANDCTSDDRCAADGSCTGTNVAAGTTCSDFEKCTGTNDKPDQCDGNGSCKPGAPLPAGDECDDGNECTNPDRCASNGSCRGTPIREGQPCQASCSSNTTCQAGTCAPPKGAAPAYNPRCVLNLCGGLETICQDRWMKDRVCECGCGYEDTDCSDACTPRMCASNAATGHKATRWCGRDGKAIDNCPDSLKGDGKCDCGCQFKDPDCEGGACCSDTGKAGCDNKFVEDCVCKHETNADASCCGDKGGTWTQRCADLAVNLGCMICP